MSDALLPYYLRELQALHEDAALFAAAHPAVAGRLRLADGAVDDPHVARLLEGVSFLAARVQHRLDDEFPELTDALLEVLYPHYLAPFPSCMIARLLPRPDLSGPALVEAGAEVETEGLNGESCRYRTAAPVTLWPIEVESARLSGLPLLAPQNPQAAGAVAVLRITLRTLAPELSFQQLGTDRLRFYLAGAHSITVPLLELLDQHVVSIALAEGAEDARPTILPGSVIESCGFDPQDALLPWSTRSFSGFRLLSEYFSHPDKFLFVELSGMEARTLVNGGRRLEIFVYLRRGDPDLERLVTRDMFVLGCTPLVNLFLQRCEPIALDHTALEYRVVPDVRREATTELWSVTRVREVRPDGTSRPWRPLHRLTEGDPEPNVAGGFYQVVRRQRPQPHGGTDLFLALSDPEFGADSAPESELHVDALCLNRNLPALLPWAEGRPRLRLIEGNAAVEEVTRMTKPTPTLRPPLQDRRSWRLISHLALGHLSVVGGSAGAQTLREVLKLYDFRNSVETQAAIDALLATTSAPGTARVPGARPGAFCRGLEVTLEFEERGWRVGGLYLLASVLERFLALHGTINSFVRTRAVLRGARASPTGRPAPVREPCCERRIRSAPAA